MIATAASPTIVPASVTATRNPTRPAVSGGCPVARPLPSTQIGTIVPCRAPGGTGTSPLSMPPAGTCQLAGTQCVITGP
jgi:hypothetical protein